MFFDRGSKLTMSVKLDNGFIALLACVALVACHKAPKFSPLPSGTTVLAFGDSVTFGVGAVSGEDYPSQLASISAWEVVNRGVSGDTSEGAKARIAEALADTQPKLVIVEIGGNDFLKRLPESQSKENIRSILQIIKQAGVPVVLVATPRFSLAGAMFGSLPDATLYAELAKEENVPLVPDVFASVLDDPQLKSDQIHPNAAGYRKLAEGIAGGLVKAGLLAKR